MSTRKPHQKTKFGCSTCRKRRVKCDLARPDCKNCTRRGLECGFRLIDPAPRSSPSGNDRSTSPYSLSLRKSNSPSASLPSPTFLDILTENGFLSDFPDILRPRFTYLLQHFATETSATITHDGSAQAAWCAAVPQLTSNHRFVLQGTLAVSALHLSRCVSTEKERKHFHDIAAAQMNTGLVRFRENVQNITEDNAEALFAFSVTTVAFTLLPTAEECSGLLELIRNSNLSLSQRNAAIDGLLSATVKIMRTLRGQLVILVPSWHLIVNGPLAPVVKRDWWPYPVPGSPQAIEEDSKLHEIEKLWSRPGRRYEYWFDILAEALRKLRECFALTSRLTINNDSDAQGPTGRLLDCGCIMGWVIKSPQGFINLIEQQRPEAWVLLAHWAILPSRAGKIWWMKDLAPNLVATAALIVGEDRWKAINWPASAVGVELQSLKPVSMKVVEIAA